MHDLRRRAQSAVKTNLLGCLDHLRPWGGRRLDINFSARYSLRPSVAQNRSFRSEVVLPYSLTKVYGFLIRNYQRRDTP